MAMREMTAVSDELDSDDLEVEVAKPFVVGDEPVLNPDGDVLIPDYIGELLGWRVWHVRNAFSKEKATLHSLGTGGHQHASMWKPGKVMEAYCARSHAVPDKNCSCGFYSAKTEEHLLSMNYHRGLDFDDPDEVLVIGEVLLQGKIIPGTQGWRAQRARPKSILVPYSRWKVANNLKERYPGVDVRLYNFHKRRGV